GWVGEPGIWKAIFPLELRHGAHRFWPILTVLRQSRIDAELVERRLEPKNALGKLVIRLLGARMVRGPIRRGAVEFDRRIELHQRLQNDRGTELRIDDARIEHVIGDVLATFVLRRTVYV